MDMKEMTVDMVNYMLRTGRLTKDDAQEYARVWNETKLSTVARVQTGTTKDGFSYAQILIVEI